tara:strand:- start:5125 stop:5265 length:141 start_codon:yes stop_codon:yes gene_type:complete
MNHKDYIGTMQAAETLCKKVGYKITDQLCLIDIGISIFLTLNKKLN